MFTCNRISNAFEYISILFKVPSNFGLRIFVIKTYKT